VHILPIPFNTIDLMNKKRNSISFLLVQGHHPQLGAHEKFTNYEFDVTEFLRIVDQAVSSVKSNHKWKRYNKMHPKDEL